MPQPEVASAEMREVEVQQLIALYDGNAVSILGRIDGQLSVLASRAQTLLSLAGITITVTGFSGANIARSGPLAAVLLVLGLVFVLLSAAQTMHGILRVRWTTQGDASSLASAVRFAIARRDEKTRIFSRALSILIVGLSLYVSSVALLLLRNLPTP